MMLLYYRKQAKLTQKEVAKYLDCAESTYSLYENGKRQIGFEDLLKLGELYNVSVEDLVGDKKNARHRRRWRAGCQEGEAY